MDLKYINGTIKKRILKIILKNQFSLKKKTVLVQ